MPLIELALAGAAVGVLVGMTGMGGGALLTPILVLLFGINPSVAVGSDLVVALVMKPVGATVHHRAGNVRWDLVRYLLPTAVPAAFLGAWFVSRFDKTSGFEDAMRIGIGVVLLVGVVAMGAQALMNRRRDNNHDTAAVILRPVPTLVIGLLGGFVVGATSVGSGSLMMVGLLAIYPMLRARDLVGTDLVQAVPIVGAAALGHLAFGSVELHLTTGLLLGAVPGTYFGARIASRIPNQAIKKILVVVLFASALQMLRLPVGIVVGAATVLALGLMLSRIQRVRTLVGRRVVRQAIRPEIGVSSSRSGF